MSEGRAHLHNAALVHDPEPGAERHRLLLVVGHHDEGDSEALLDIDELELGVLAQLLVERGERLIEQQQLRSLHERPRQRHALALPAGELVGLASAEAGHLDDLEDLADLAARSPRGSGLPAPARRRRSSPRSCAGRAHRTGTSCSPAARRAGSCSCPRRRSGCCRRWESRTRPACAAASSCPSPSRPAGRRSPRGGYRARHCRRRQSRRTSW